MPTGPPSPGSTNLRPPPLRGQDLRPIVCSWERNGGAQDEEFLKEVGGRRRTCPAAGLHILRPKQVTDPLASLEQDSARDVWSRIGKKDVHEARLVKDRELHDESEGEARRDGERATWRRPKRSEAKRGEARRSWRLTEKDRRKEELDK